MNANQTGGLISARRKELGLSQSALAERLHVTDKAVSRWETGRGMPAIDTLEPLAAALELSVSELLDGRRLAEAELPKTAGRQIVESLRKGKRRLWLGAAAALGALALAAASFLTVHWVTSAAQTDLAGLTHEAAVYFAKDSSLEWITDARRGDYLAALYRDGDARVLCVYERDAVFPDRWRSTGGKTGMRSGELDTWNYGSVSGEAVLIFCGSDLPRQAACYAFENSGIAYRCPISEGQVLDICLLPDTQDLTAHHLTLLDQEQTELETAGPDHAALR